MISKNSRGARATSTGDQAPARAGVEVELRHLRKSFHEGRSERSVLRDVNASFRAGEFIVLLGRSGSGKSTLLNLIAGLEVPSAGTTSPAPWEAHRAGEPQWGVSCSSTLFEHEHEYEYDFEHEEAGPNSSGGCPVAIW